MDLRQFHTQVKYYLRFCGKSQQELAITMSFHPHVLSHKLKGSDNYTLNQQNIKDIILALANWGSFLNKQQVLEMLALMDLTEAAFTPAQWQEPPLNGLRTISPAKSPDKPRAAAPVNLPTPMTSLVGRQELIAQYSARLVSPPTRLLTLTGMGGVGKTRLGLEIAAKSKAAFEDGIYFVNLNPVREAALVPGRIAEALELRQDARSDILGQLKSYLKKKSLLLVLDNMEQILEAAALVADLLEVAPRLKILATSRKLLDIYGEYEAVVPPLSLPSLTNGQVVNEKPPSEAVQLFIERSTAANAAFQVTTENELAIARICITLEGLPLAIELAAAWSKFFTPPVLLSQLAGLDPKATGKTPGNRLKVLAGSSTGLPARHQSLRNLLDWSYNLLTPLEQRLFNRLGIFDGSFTWEAAQAICWSEGLPPETYSEHENAFFYLKRLVNHSLLKIDVTAPPTEPASFILLETLREYAFEKLQQSGEMNLLRERHAAYYLEMVREAEPYLQKSDQVWLKRLVQAQSNFWSILEWYKQDQARAAQHLAFVGCLWRFWRLEGRLSEGLERLKDSLLQAERQGGLTETLEYARVLSGAGTLASFLGDLDLSEAYSKQSLALMRQLANPLGIAGNLNNLALVAWQRREYDTYNDLLLESLEILNREDDLIALAACLSNLGIVAQVRGEYSKARNYLTESLALRQETGDRVGVGICLNNLGLLAQRQDDYPAAKKFYLESLNLKRELNDRLGIMSLLTNLGVLLLHQSDFDLAGEALTEGLKLGRQLGYKSKVIICLNNLGLTAYFKGDYKQAASLYLESLHIANELKDLHAVAIIIIGLGAINYREGHLLESLRLFGLADTLIGNNAALKETNKPHIKIYHETLEYLRNRLDSQTFNEIWSKGRQISLDELSVESMRLIIAS